MEIISKLVRFSGLAGACLNVWKFSSSLLRKGSMFRNTDDLGSRRFLCDGGL